MAIPYIITPAPRGFQILSQALATEPNLAPTLPASFWQNREFVLLCVEKRGHFLQHADASLKDDPKVVFASIRLSDCGAGLDFASARLRNSRDFVKQCLKKSCLALAWAGDDLARDPEMFKEALECLPSQVYGTNSPSGALAHTAIQVIVMRMHAEVREVTEIVFGIALMLGAHGLPVTELLEMDVGLSKPVTELLTQFRERESNNYECLEAFDQLCKAEMAAELHADMRAERYAANDPVAPEAAPAKRRGRL